MSLWLGSPALSQRDRGDVWVGQLALLLFWGLPFDVENVSSTNVGALAWLGESAADHRTGKRSSADAHDRSEMELREQIETLIAPTMESMGFDTVRVLLMGKKDVRLQIMVERQGGGGMTVDDCASLSRAISAVLEMADPMPGRYTLEVSSPGLDRPLVRLGDFDRFSGFEARIETAESLRGRKRFRGRLLGVQGETVHIRTEDGECALPFSGIARAKLVITDDLLSASRNN